MLETDEVDNDYFTPVSNATLSSIFNKSIEPTNTSNSSLKYTAPKANTSSKSEEGKQTKCLFASALYGYQWSKDVYTAKGKLGFAIINTVNTNIHSIVLYDSHKKTLSYASISSTFEVTTRGKSYISYYDDFKNYWTLYAQEQEINTITEKLKLFNVTLNHENNEDRVPPKPENSELTENFEVDAKTFRLSKEDNYEKFESEANTIRLNKEEIESDSESSINRKTKASILSRMASMGQAILPTANKFSDKTSDSSDTNEYISEPKLTRHKTNKSVVKRIQDKISPDISSGFVDEIPQKTLTRLDQGDNQLVTTVLNGQLMPLTNQTFAPISHFSVNDFNLLMSEQRVNNSELRVNLNRINDKVDQVLDQLKQEKQKDNIMDTNFQATILQKLLAEYEHKIKMYEAMLSSKEINPFSLQHYHDTHKVEKKDEDNGTKIKNLRSELEQKEKSYLEIIDKKDFTIISLKEEIKRIKTPTTELKLKENEDNLAAQESLSLKTITKVKSIMNDTFQAISSHFENDEQYSGQMIKSVVGTAIKKITMDSLF